MESYRTTPNQTEIMRLLVVILGPVIIICAKLTSLVPVATLSDPVVIRKGFVIDVVIVFRRLEDILFSNYYLLDYFPSFNGFYHTSLRKEILYHQLIGSCVCLGVTQVSLLSNKKSFSCIIHISSIKTASAANESLWLHGLILPAGQDCDLLRYHSAN